MNLKKFNEELIEILNEQDINIDNIVSDLCIKFDEFLDTNSSMNEIDFDEKVDEFLSDYFNNPNKVIDLFKEIYSSYSSLYEQISNAVFEVIHHKVLDVFEDRISD